MSDVKTTNLTDEIKSKITRQLNFYFSDSNYPKDKYLLEESKKNDGWIDVENFAKFNKIKEMTSDVGVIGNCFKECNEVIVSDDGGKVKRKHPVPDLEVLNSRSVVVSGFSSTKNIDKEKVSEFFTKYGKVISVWHQKSSNRKVRCATVEFDKKEDAEKAVAAGTETFKEDDKEYKLTIVNKSDFVKEEEEIAKKFNEKKEKRNNNNNNNKKAKYEEKELISGIFLKVEDLKSLFDENKAKRENIDVIKAAFAEYGKVEFIDDEHSIIRFSDPEASKSTLKAITEGKTINDKKLTASILEGEEEQKYIETVKEKRNNSQNKKRKFNRKQRD